MEEYPMEFAKQFLICFDVLSRSNVNIFDENEPFFKKYWKCFLFVPCAILFHMSLSADVYRIVSGGEQIFQLAYTVPVMFVATHGILKAAIVVRRKPEIRAIIRQLGPMWRTKDLNDEQTGKKNALLRRLNLCNAVFYWMNIIGSWQYIYTPLLETLFRRFILQQEFEPIFPFACSFPFNPNKNWLIYITVYVAESITMLHIVYIYLGAELLMITLCAHLSTEFTLLQEDLLHVRPTSLKNRCDVNGGRHYERRMKDIIKRHQNVIMLSRDLDEIFNKMIFINLIFATVTICFFGFVAKVARGPVDMANNFVGVVASMLPIFNLCYYGELLSGASTGMASSAYHNLWYTGDADYQKSMCFIMKRSQRPCSLTSLKYAPITLRTFTTVLSTTWSYFSLANSLYEE